MKKLYPLKFKSILKNKIWGGDKIVSCYNKQFCEDETIDITHIGESWEICDMFGDQTIVNNGFLEGNSLEEILETYLGDLVGEKVYGRVAPSQVKKIIAEYREGCAPGEVNNN